MHYFSLVICTILIECCCVLNAQEELCQVSGDVLSNMSLTLGICGWNGTRQMKYRIKPGTYNCRQLDKESLKVPSSVDSSTCSVSCPPGSALAAPTLSTLEMTDSSLYCRRCPENTYSVGGGTLIQNWILLTSPYDRSKIPFPFETECYGFNESRLPTRSSSKITLVTLSRRK
jgi:hypothetical protein